MRTPFDHKALKDVDMDSEDRPFMADRFERCAYCNTKLLFTHDLNLTNLEVTENGRCPACGVHTQPRKHTLH